MYLLNDDGIVRERKAERPGSATIDEIFRTCSATSQVSRVPVDERYVSNLDAPTKDRIHNT